MKKINLKKIFSQKARLRISVVILLVLLQISYFYLPLSEYFGQKSVVPQAKAANNTGRVVYGDAGGAAPSTRTWDGTAFSTAGSAATAVATIQYAVNKEATTRSEYIIGTSATTGVTTFQVYNGSWGNAFSSTPGVGTTNDAYRGFDIAYEQISGDGLVVYEDNSSANTNIKYNTWNGSSWGGEASLTVNSANVLWARMEVKPFTNEIMLVTLDSNSDIYAYVWDGSGWGSAQLLTADASVTTSNPFDLAYEGLSGDALVAYGDLNGAGTDTIDFWTYSGGSWTDGTGAGAVCTGDGTTNACASTAGVVVNLNLSGNSENNYIAMGIDETTGDDFIAQIWDGTQWLLMPQAVTLWDEAGAVENLASEMPQNVTYEANGKRFMFLYVLNGLLTAQYFFYDIDGADNAPGGGDDNTWYNGDGTTSITDIDSVTTTTGANTTTDDMEWINLTPNPIDASQIMLTVTDILGVVRSRLWNGSAWSTPTNGDHGDAGTVAIGSPVSFFWDRTVNVTTVGTSGSQTTNLAIGTTDKHVGGALTFINNSTSANVTSIKISEKGNVNANSNLTNVKLLYKQEATCSSTVPAGTSQFGTTGTFNASDESTFTGTMSVGTSQICVYVTFNIGTGATVGQTIEIEITAPQTDVTSAANAITPSAAVAISGMSTLGALVTVGTTGSQTANLALDRTNKYIGGAFTFSQNLSTNNVTSITVTENGSVDALNNLDNIQLYYDLDTSAPYNCASESYVGGETQYGTTDTTGFSAANGTSVFTGSVATTATQTMCVYVVLDITSGASSGQTIEVEISNPSTDVVSGAAEVTPATAIAISGTTTIGGLLTVATTGSQTSSFPIGGTAKNVGGVFTFVQNGTSYNVTSITIAENGTVDAQTNLDNIKIRYDLDTSAPYNCASESYAVTDTQYGSTDTDGFSAANGTSAFTGSVATSPTQTMCVYVELDIGTGATASQTIEIEISNPTTDVASGAIEITPATAIAISGTSTLADPVLTVSDPGTQKAEMGIPSTNNYIGAAFTFIRDATSTNVTSITLNEEGTVAADSELSNVIVWYKQEETCSTTTVPGDATQFNSTPGSFNVSDIVTVTGTMSVGTSQICIYVTVNVLSAADNGDIYDLEITNPSVDVVVSSNTVTPATPVVLSGTTTLSLPDYVSYGAAFLYTQANWGTGGAGADFYFETYWKATSGNVYARVYDETAAGEVTDSIIYSPSTSFIRSRTSTAITLIDGHTYRAQIGHVTGSAGQIYSARLLTNAALDSGADLAEYYGSDEALELGEVVAIDSAKIAFVKGSTTPYQKDLLGIVSTQPGMILGANIGQSYPIALVGRVPVKVTTENGTIKTGDFVTSSSTKGFGMKATIAGRVLGQALETFDSSKTYVCPKGTKTNVQCGTVMVFVNLTNYLGQSIDMAMTESPSANLSVLGLNVAPDSDTSTEGLSSTDSNIFIPSYNAPDKESQILAFLERNQEQASSSASLSEIFTGRVSASSAVIAPQIITDILYARTIKADRIEGLEILTNQISTLNRQVSVLSTATQSAELATNSANINLSGLNLNSSATASADFNIKGNSLVEGMLMVLKSVTTPNLLVSDFASFFGDVFFKKNVSFEGRPTFNSDTAGFAVINKGQKSIEVNFDDEYISTPVVAVSIALNKGTDDEIDKKLEDAVLSGNISYVITQRTTKGFVIRLNQTATSDIDFSWIAISVKNAKTQRLDLRQTSVSFDPVSTQSAAFQSILNQLNNNQ